MNNNYAKSLGPIALSALSLFISFLIIQLLNPSISLLSSRGTGKIIFISMVIYQILLFLSIQQKPFMDQFFDRTLFFFVKERWLSKFSLFFISFFSLHALLLFSFYQSGYVLYQPNWGVISIPLIAKTFFGLFVVFMLAWTEELIFRGTIYPYLAQYHSPLTGLFMTSFIFMIVHDIKNPLSLLTTNWELGLGLFLLGFLLNQIFIITGKLYTGMGVHAGLVFVKVILRRAPFLKFVDETQWAWWINKDLRQAHIVHILFAIIILILFLRHKENFIQKKGKI